MASRISEDTWQYLTGRGNMRVITVIGKKVFMTVEGEPDSQGSMKMSHRIYPRGRQMNSLIYNQKRSRMDEQKADNQSPGQF